MFYERLVYFNEPPEQQGSVPDGANEPGTTEQAGILGDAMASYNDAMEARFGLSEAVQANSPIVNMDKRVVLERFETVQIDDRPLIAILGDDLRESDHPLKTLEARRLVVRILAESGLQETNPEFIENMNAALETERQTGETDAVMYEQYLTILEALQSHLNIIEQIDGPTETFWQRQGRAVSRWADRRAEQLERANDVEKFAFYGIFAAIAAFALVRGGEANQKFRTFLGRTAAVVGAGAAVLVLAPRAVWGQDIFSLAWEGLNRRGNRDIAEAFGAEYSNDEDKAAVDLLMYSVYNSSMSTKSFSDVIAAYNTGSAQGGRREIPQRLAGRSREFQSLEARRALFEGVGLISQKYGPGSDMYENDPEVRAVWENAMQGRKTWSEVVLELMGHDEDIERLSSTYTGEIMRGAGGFASRNYERFRRSSLIDGAINYTQDELDDGLDLIRDTAEGLPYGDQLVEYFSNTEYPQSYLREHAGYSIREVADIQNIPGNQFAPLAYRAFELRHDGTGIFQDAVGMQYTLVKVRIERPYRDSMPGSLARAFSEGMERFEENGDASEVNAMFGAIDKRGGYYYLAMFNRPEDSLAANSNLTFSPFPEDDFEEFDGYIDSRLRLKVMADYQLDWDQAETVINHFAREHTDGERLFAYLSDFQEHRDEVAALLTVSGASYEFNQSGWDLYQDMVQMTLASTNNLVHTDAYVPLTLYYAAAINDENIAEQLGLSGASSDQILEAFEVTLSEYTDRELPSLVSGAQSVEELTAADEIMSYRSSVLNFRSSQGSGEFAPNGDEIMLGSSFHGVLVYRDEYRSIYATVGHGIINPDDVVAGSDDENYPVNIVDQDQSNDLALVEIDNRSLRNRNDRVVDIRETELSDNENVYMLTDNTIHSGRSDTTLPAAFEDTIEDFNVPRENLVASTIDTRPGQSGSPILDSQGRLVGLLHGEFGYLEDNNDYSAMIRASLVRDMLDRHLSNGSSA